MLLLGSRWKEGLFQLLNPQPTCHTNARQTSKYLLGIEPGNDEGNPRFPMKSHKHSPTRKTDTAQPPEEPVLFDPRFLEQHTGSTLLHDPVSAIVELVANCWDAAATNVDIEWPSSSGKTLLVHDNGQGMTEEQFLRRWRTLSYDRIKEQGDSVAVVGRPELPIRPVFGRNGIGRFAGFCFGSEYTVVTAAGGTQIRYAVRRGSDKPIVLEKLGETQSTTTGTTIEVVQGGQTPLQPETVRSELGKRFLTDPAFQVSVNSRRIEFEDIGQKGVEKFEIPIEGMSPTVHILMIDTERTDRTTKQHGVAWRINGRLVGQCAWQGNGFDDLIDGRRIEAKRYTFIVFADCLASHDVVEGDWSRFKEGNAIYQNVKGLVVQKLRDLLLGVSKERRQETTKEVRRVNAANLRRMTPLSREKWNEFVDKAAETCPSLSQQELQTLSGVLANLEISHSRYGLLNKLHELNPDQLDDLHDILKEWSLDMAKIVLDELQVRIKLVDELQAKTSTKETLEVQELQPLFHRGLWIFGPEFETIEFTSNRGMTTVIQELFGTTTRGSRNRPDFVILPDSTVGLYSYPTFDEHGAEGSVDRVVLIELKKPGVPISEDQKSQCWKYVKELYQKGLLADATRVDCYVLGLHIAQNERGHRTENDGKVRIIPMDFDTVLTRAKSRLLRLYERVKEAPFLQGQDIDKFLNAAVELDGEMPLPEESPAVSTLTTP